MISSLSGKLIYKNLTKIVIDVSGIGFEVLISSRLFEKLPALNKEVYVETYMHVREDGILLAGFSSQKEKELFLKLISVSGVSIKIAMVIFSFYSPEELGSIIASGEPEMLRRVPGIGGKLSERIILELKGKITDEFPDSRVVLAGNNKINEITDALKSLGYSGSEIHKALQKIDKKIIESATLEVILKAVLKEV